MFTAAALLLGGSLSAGTKAEPLSAAQLDRQANALAQRARDTGDVTYYTRAETAYRSALDVTPRDLPATIGLGALALSRHEFRRGLMLGRRALALSPSTAAGYGVVGDALVELGRYPEAFAAFDRMVSLKPGVSSYARVSYALELPGDVRRRGAGDAACRGRGDRRAGGARLDAHAARQALLVSRAHRRGGARVSRRAARSSGLRPCARCARAGRGRTRSHGSRDRTRAPRVRSRCRCRSSSTTLGDLYQSGRGSQRQYDARRRRSSGCSARTASRSTSKTALFDVDHGDPAARARSRSRAPRAPSGRRSTATTSWLGRSRATAAAARRCATRSARSGSARSTRPSSSTAG